MHLVDRENLLAEQRRAAGNLTEEEAHKLRHFADYGYMVLELGVDPKLLDNAVAQVAEMYERRPSAQVGNDLVSLNGRITNVEMPLSLFPPGYKAKPGARLQAAHSCSSALHRLVLNPAIHRYIGLILEETPVAVQSLYFKYGSKQGLHRDPWYVVTNPPSSMLASWLALEDIDPDSGPLVYIPRSHRMPYRPMPNGDICHLADGYTQHHRDANYKAFMGDLRRYQLKPTPFTPRKGQVFIWHTNLVHGGSAVNDPNRTRESFVVHYDMLKNRPSTGISASTRKKGGLAPNWFETSKVGADAQCRAFAFESPIIDTLKRRDLTPD
jgi:ectoine hydroxylase-related dioxygenase (phytanoyl-CoA dioxygenase family)